MNKTLEDLLPEARAAGVTMIILDGTRNSCWSKTHRRYFTVRDSNPATGLRDALMQAMDPNYDPEILI